MPSKSKAQHNLMAMVANNPAAAKRLGIPQSVGQEFMKADKRKAKKFRIGGPSSYAGGDDSGEGMEMSTRRMPSGEGSFKEAFAAARKAGDGTFTWKGKKYTTELAGSKKPAAAAAAPKVEVEKKVETKVETPAPAKRPMPKGKLPEGYRPKVGSGRYDDPTSSYGERVTAPFRALGDIFGRRREEGVMRNMGVDRAEAARRLARLDEVRESEGMKRGGKVKKAHKYKSGGSVSSASKRADGCATKGKTRGKFV